MHVIVCYLVYNVPFIHFKRGGPSNYSQMVKTDIQMSTWLNEKFHLWEVLWSSEWNHGVGVTGCAKALWQVGAGDFQELKGLCGWTSEEGAREFRVFYTALTKTMHYIFENIQPFLRNLQTIYTTKPHPWHTLNKHPFKPPALRALSKGQFLQLAALHPCLLI